MNKLKITKKGVSPLIATILLIVVAVILVTVLLTWGKGFFTSALDDADARDITSYRPSDVTSFIYRPSLEGSLLRFSYNPPSNLANETIVIDGYSVVGYTGDFNLTPNVTLKAGMSGFTGVDVSSLNITDPRIDLVLYTNNDEIINLRNTQYTIPVGPPVLLPYVINNSNSKLYLQPDQNTTNMNWQTAKDYCADLNAHGYDDWYLPSISQLVDVWLACTDQSKTTVCMNTAISDTDQTDVWVDITDDVYWSSTEYSSSSAYAIYMGPGAIIYDYTKASDKRVRCVRDP
jgi:flagellin-like protein